jgi:hypothetical protein
MTRLSKRPISVLQALEKASLDPLEEQVAEPHNKR